MLWNAREGTALNMQGNSQQHGQALHPGQQAFVPHLAAPAVPVMVPFGYNSPHPLPQQFEAPLRAPSTPEPAREQAQPPPVPINDQGTTVD